MKGLGLKASAGLDAGTLSGLFMQRQSRMPKTGDSIIEDSYCLRVDSLIDKGVGQVLIERLSEETGESSDTPADLPVLACAAESAL